VVVGRHVWVAAPPGSLQKLALGQIG